MAVGAALAVTLAAIAGCGPSQRSQVRQAIQDHYPDGMHNCFALSPDVIGMHVPVTINETVYYDRGSLLSPIRHIYVAYAAPAANQPPELIAMLTRDGVLTRHVVTAHSDTQSSRMGPQKVSPQDIFYHADIFSHDRRDFDVAVYTTAPNDRHFAYEAHTSTKTMSWGGPTFPLRIYNGDLPAADTQYAIPLVEPYAVSIVSAACTLSTIDSIDQVARGESLGGHTYVNAQVTLAQEAPDWMRTPAFSRAVGDIDAGRLTAPIQAVFAFDTAARGDRLYWVQGGS